MTTGLLTIIGLVGALSVIAFIGSRVRQSGFDAAERDHAERVAKAGTVRAEVENDNAGLTDDQLRDKLRS